MKEIVSIAVRPHSLVGKRLDAYHDGKYSPSRLVTVEVLDVVDMVDLEKKYRRVWKRAIDDDFKNSLLGEGIVIYLDGPQRFWDWNCDRFVFGKIVGDKRTEKDPLMFARMGDGRSWYAVNWNYKLDVNGVIRRKMLKHWKEAAAEMGQTMKWNAKAGKYDYFDKHGKKVEV